MSNNNEKKYWIKELADWIYLNLKLSQEDAIVAALFAVGGFTFDIWLTPTGTPPGTVAVLSGAAGMVMSKYARCSAWFQKKVYRKIDKHWPEEERDTLKKKLREKWEEECLGIHNRK